MIRGMYTAAAGLKAQMARQMMLANNLANVDTLGYKQDVADFEAFSSMFLSEISRVEEAVRTGATEITPIGTISNGVEQTQPTVDLSQGQITETGNELDVALSTPGYFVVQTPEGNFYTRAGSFMRDAQGNLVDPDGALVLGQAGPIKLPEGQVQISGDGTITVNNQRVDQLRVVDFPAGVEIHKIGHNYLRPVDTGVNPIPATAVTVNQGFVERSNVDTANVLSMMMGVARAYEAAQRLVQMQDQVTQQTVSQVGQV